MIEISSKDVGVNHSYQGVSMRFCPSFLSPEFYLDEFSHEGFLLLLFFFPNNNNCRNGSFTSLLLHSFLDTFITYFQASRDSLVYLFFLI